MTGTLTGWRDLVAGPVVRLASVSTSCSRGAMLDRIGLAMCRHSFLNMVNPGNNKGAALVGVVLKLLGPTSNDIHFCGGRGRMPRVTVKCLPRCGDVSGGFPVSMCRIMLSKLGGRGSLFRHCAPRRHRLIDQVVTHVNLRNLRDHTVNRLDKKRLRHTLLKHTLISGPRIIVLSRPGACVSGQFRTGLCSLLRRVGGRQTVVLMDRSVNAILRGMGAVTYIGRALSCRPSARMPAR